MLCTAQVERGGGGASETKTLPSKNNYTRSPSTDIINITKRGVSLPVRTHPQHIKFIAVSTYMYLPKQEHYKNIKTTPYHTKQSNRVHSHYTTAQRSIHCSRETFSTNNNAAGFAAMYFIIRNLIDNFVLPTFSGYSISALFSNIQCMRLQIIIMYVWVNMSKIYRRNRATSAVVE